MKKRTRGFGLGGKNGGERKRDEPRKKKVTTITSNWGTKKAKTKETAERSPGRHQPSYEVREIEIADIKIGEKRRSLNAEKLNDLMQSIPVLGFRQPITVRTFALRRDWKNAKREYLLVSGLHRLEAMKQLGETKIPCFVMKGDERVARMWEISENLHRAELTPLEYDEQVVEWVKLVKLLEADPGFSGQNVQKKGRGRPKGGTSEAARKLPVKGKTLAAKRKTMERALEVDNMFPEAKDAVKKAGLDKNRSKYLKVAAEETLEAQLAKVQELTPHKSETKRKRNALRTKHKATKADLKTPLCAEDQKALEHLLKAWNDAARKVREQFLEKIRQDHSLSTAQHGRSTRSQWA